MYGGAFNPPHLDHGRIVAELLGNLTDKVLIIPTGRRNDKRYPGVADVDRELMLRLATEDFGDAVEIDTEFLYGSGETTTRIQADYLRRKYGRDIPQVFGSDTVRDMFEWDPTGYVARELPKVFVSRSGYPLDSAGILNFDTVDFESSGLSSTEIRDAISRPPSGRIDRGKLEKMLHANVLDFILKNGIYTQ